jgi:hypothetical protein
MLATLEDFAVNHRLRTRKDGCGDYVIPGENQHQIFDNGDGRLGVLLMFDTVGKWNNRRKLMTAAGFESRQDAETEGTCLFDPTDRAQAKLAIKLTGARAKRVLSPEKAKALAERLKAAREAKLAA